MLLTGTPRHPGVFIQEVAGGARPIESVPTAIAAFIAWASRGVVGEPVLTHGWNDYEAEFGLVGSDDVMGLAARAFFHNGGRDAYFVRLAKNPQAPFALLDTKRARELVRVEARSPGPPPLASPNAIRIVSSEAKEGDPVPRFTLELGRAEDAEFEVPERYEGLSMDPADARYAPKVLGRSSPGSPPVILTLTSASRAAAAATRGFVQGGALQAPAPPDEAVGEAAESYLAATLLSAMPLNLNVNGHGLETTEPIPFPDLDLASKTETDAGHLVASKLQAAIRALHQVEAEGDGEAERDPLADLFQQITVEYDPAAARFTITSDRSVSSSVVATGPLAQALKLDADGLATNEHGSAGLVPTPTVADGKPAAVQLRGGSAAPPGPSEYEELFGSKLKKLKDVSIVVLPGQHLPAGGGSNPVIDAAIAHCEETGSRMVIVDPPPEVDLAAQRDSVQLPTSRYAALYYPWVKIPNPFRGAEGGEATVPVAPSAFAAGVWSRTDARRGVWKAPAGVETGLLGVAGLWGDPDDADQDQLNPYGINCLRRLPSIGPVVWGARTCAVKSAPEWKYVPVRRTAIFIERSIYEGIQWAVFEPNDHRLWAALRANVEAFMDGLFRAGAFQGEKASDAYSVRCGLGSTMTQADIDLGQVIIVVEFAPLKPAEFVVVRIQQKLSQ